MRITALIVVIYIKNRMLRPPINVSPSISSMEGFCFYKKAKVSCFVSKVSLFCAKSILLVSFKNGNGENKKKDTSAPLKAFNASFVTLYANNSMITKMHHALLLDISQKINKVHLYRSLRFHILPLSYW